VQVNTQVVGFKKIKFGTMENVGAGQLTLPEQEMHTTAYWLTLAHEAMETLPYDSTERQDGVHGLANAMQAIGTLLLMCDARDLGVAVGENEEQKAEKRSQKSEDRRQEAGVRSQNGEDGRQESGVGSRQDAQGGADVREFRVSSFEFREPRTPNPEPRIPTALFEPNIYLYDKYPGGIGFSEPLFRLSETLLDNTKKLIANCPCQAGCPSCVGPAGEIGEKGKEVALAILRVVSGR